MTRLTLVTWDHDRAMPLHRGTVAIQGIDLQSEIHPTSSLFPIAAQEARFDITEMSLSTHILQVSRGPTPYAALPVFLSRAFRHNGFFAREGSDIATPAELGGRTIGIPEHQMTAGLWMRGILQDEYGVDLSTIRCRTGALDTGIRCERLALDLPEGMIVEPVGDGKTLQDLLLDGRIDALLTPKPPTAFLAGDIRIRRLVPDYETAEAGYHRRTGFFPIMHVVAIRASLLEDRPDLGRAVYDAFDRAKAIAVARLKDIWLGAANRLTLPWLGASMERAITAIGDDFWS